MFDGLEWFFNTALICMFTLAPLGVWKLIEIIIWFFGHIHWS